MVAGQTAFETQCAGCHGDDGTGGTGPAFNFDNGLGSSNNTTITLAEFITNYMPTTDTTACIGECATNIAAYLQSDQFGPTYTITTIDNCGVDEGMSGVNSSVFFDQSTNAISGWSHVADEHPYNDVLALNYDNALYQVPGVTTADSTCNNLDTQNVILLKKYANWDKQHSNGIEIAIPGNYAFEDVDSISFEMKLNVDSSVIKTNDELKAIYGDLLTDAQYEQLDQGKAAFAISIIDPSGGTNIQAERYIEIDPAVYGDQWVRVTIPFAKMDIFTGEAWEKFPATDTQATDTQAARIQINPETLGADVEPKAYGNVIRNFIDETWDTSNITDPTVAPNETFKELSISIKKLEINWK